MSYEETDQQLKESFAQIQMLAWGLILFVGLIGILNIINTVYTNIHTRVTEIGMQRAIGMSADSLYKTFLWEGAYYGIIASVIGSVLGYVCTIFIEAATSDTIQLVAIPVMPILEATLLAVGACLLATAIPLRKISKMNIVDSIERLSRTLFFEMSERCNNSACFSVEIKGTSDICVTFVVYDDYKSKITFT